MTPYQEKQIDSFYCLAAAIRNYITAKSLQSCPTLCDPIPGILQTRTLEWVAISFSNAWKWKVKVKSLSHVWLFATLDCSSPGSSVHGIFQAKSTGVECHCISSSIKKKVKLGYRCRWSQVWIFFHIDPRDFPRKTPLIHFAGGTAGGTCFPCVLSSFAFLNAFLSWNWTEFLVTRFSISSRVTREEFLFY